MTRLSLLGYIRKISAGRAPNNKPLIAVVGTIGCAPSNESSFKLCYHTDFTNLSDLCIRVF